VLKRVKKSAAFNNIISQDKLSLSANEADLTNNIDFERIVSEFAIGLLKSRKSKLLYL